MEAETEKQAPRYDRPKLSLVADNVQPYGVDFYIGGMEGASDIDLLRANNITTVVNCAVNLDFNFVTQPLSPAEQTVSYGFGDIRYYKLGLIDGPGNPETMVLAGYYLLKGALEQRLPPACFGLFMMSAALDVALDIAPLIQLAIPPQAASNSVKQDIGHQVYILGAPGLAQRFAHKFYETLFQRLAALAVAYLNQRAQNLDQRPVGDTFTVRRTMAFEDTRLGAAFAAAVLAGRFLALDTFADQARFADAGRAEQGNQMRMAGIAHAGVGGVNKSQFQGATNQGRL